MRQDLDFILHTVSTAVIDISKELFYGKPRLKNCAKRELEYMIPSVFGEEFIKAQEILRREDPDANDAGWWAAWKIIDNDEVIVFELNQLFGAGYYMSSTRYFVVFLKQLKRAYLIRLDVDSIVEIEDVLQRMGVKEIKRLSEPEGYAFAIEIKKGEQ